MRRRSVVLRVTDPRRDLTVIDLPMDVLFGKPPRMHRNAKHIKPRIDCCPISPVSAWNEALLRVLRLPTVGSKSFLITIGDRTRRRAQSSGPDGRSVAGAGGRLRGDLADFDGYVGEAMAMAERAPVAVLNSADAARLAVGEAITNLAAAPIASLGEIRLSANWMAAVNHPGEDAALFDAVKAVGMELCPRWSISIPVGKDSLSMQTRVAGRRHIAAHGIAGLAGDHRFCPRQRRSPHADAAIATGSRPLRPVADRSRRGARSSRRLRADPGVQPWRRRATGSGRCQAAEGAVRSGAGSKRGGLLLAYHDRSDGGVIVTLLEMAFAGHCGLEIHLDGWAEATLRALFNEELGAVLQVAEANREAFEALLVKHGLAGISHRIGRPKEKLGIKLFLNGDTLFKWNWSTLFKAWNETSYAMQRLRDNPVSADAEQHWRATMPIPASRRSSTSIRPRMSPRRLSSIQFTRPRIAVLREQGVNGQVEMAAAFTRAGFDAVDVHMSDLASGRIKLADFRGLAACGGFSYGDVLGAGRGWATSILFNEMLRAQFRRSLPIRPSSRLACATAAR
jgi:phosphoribosylformylglycinamidine synthase